MPPAVKAAKALRCPLVAPPYANFPTICVLAFQLLLQLEGTELEVAMDKMETGKARFKQPSPLPALPFPFCLAHSGFPRGTTHRKAQS